MRRVLDGVALALSWLTIAPVRGPHDVDRAVAGRAIGAAPVAGLGPRRYSDGGGVAGRRCGGECGDHRIGLCRIPCPRDPRYAHRRPSGHRGRSGLLRPCRTCPGGDEIRGRRPLRSGHVGRRTRPAGHVVRCTRRRGFVGSDRIRSRVRPGGGRAGVQTRTPRRRRQRIRSTRSRLAGAREDRDVESRRVAAAAVCVPGPCGSARSRWSWH